MRSKAIGYLAGAASSEDDDLLSVVYQTVFGVSMTEVATPHPGVVMF